MNKTPRFFFGALAAMALVSCNSGENKLEQNVTRDMMTVTIADGQKVFTKNQAKYTFDLYNPNDAQLLISSLNMAGTASSLNNILFSDLSFGVMQGSVGDGSTTGTGYKFALAPKSSCPALSAYSISDFNVYLGGYNYANASYSITLNNNIFITSFATLQAYFTKTTVNDPESTLADYVTYGPQTNQVQININADLHVADVTIYQAKFASDQPAEDIVYRNIPVDITPSALTISSSQPITPTKTGNADAEPRTAFTADAFTITIVPCYASEGRMQLRIGKKLINSSLLEFLPQSTIDQ